VADATVSTRADSLGAGLELTDGAELGTGVADRAAVVVVAPGAGPAAVRDAEGRPANATPPEIRS